MQSLVTHKMIGSCNPIDGTFLNKEDTSNEGYACIAVRAGGGDHRHHAGGMCRLPRLRRRLPPRQRPKAAAAEPTKAPEATKAPEPTKAPPRLLPPPRRLSRPRLPLAPAAALKAPIPYPDPPKIEVGAEPVKRQKISEIVTYKALPEYKEPAWVTDLVKAGKLPADRGTPAERAAGHPDVRHAQGHRRLRRCGACLLRLPHRRLEPHRRHDCRLVRHRVLVQQLRGARAHAARSSAPIPMSSRSRSSPRAGNGRRTANS